MACFLTREEATLPLWLLRFPGMGVSFSGVGGPFSAMWTPKSGFWHVWSAFGPRQVRSVRSIAFDDRDLKCLRVRPLVEHATRSGDRCYRRVVLRRRSSTRPANRKERRDGISGLTTRHLTRQLVYPLAAKYIGGSYLIAAQAALRRLRIPADHRNPVASEVHRCECSAHGHAREPAACDRRCGPPTCL